MGIRIMNCNCCRFAPFVSHVCHASESTLPSYCGATGSAYLGPSPD
jgi:hypothetical protein